MRIRLLTTYAGPLGCYGEGTDPAIDDRSKQVLVDAGYAVCLDRPIVETAAVAVPETAAMTPKAYGGRVKK